MSESALRVMPGIGIAIGMLISAVTGALAQSSTAKDPWPELASNIFSGRPIADGTSMLVIEMPGRAEDAAIVPLTLRVTLAPTETRRIASFTIVIDENPAPVAATFTIGPGAIVPVISTRVRVNSYTNVHAVAELSDGGKALCGEDIRESFGRMFGSNDQGRQSRHWRDAVSPIGTNPRGSEQHAHSPDHDPSPE